MRLLYAVPFWPHLFTPFLFREIAWMRSRGHAVAVVSLRRWPDGQVNVERFGLHDVPVLQIRPTYRSDGKLLADLARLAAGGAITPGWTTLGPSMRQQGVRQGLQDWATSKRLLAFVRRFRPDLIDAHWASDAAAVARRLSGLLSIPYTVTLHGGDIHTQPSPNLASLVQDAAAVYPVSSFLARELARLVAVDPAKVTLRPHGLPAESIAGQPAAQSDSEFVIGSTGRLDPEKRQQDLLEAAAPLVREFPRLRLRLIGGGQLHCPLQARAAQLGIADCLEITGPLPWAQVMDQVRALHIYVQPSQLEGFGLTTLEAASQGLPLIATRTGAHDQIIEHGRTGYLYDAGDVSALRQHLRTLLGDADLRRRLGQAVLDHVRRNFVFENLMQQQESRFLALAGR